MQKNEKESKKGITRGVIAKETGINAETIRYYEKIELLQPPARSRGGHRIYNPEHAQRLRFIKRCRELGFTLEEIRGLLMLVDRQEVSCQRVQHIADEHALSIRQKINDLKKMAKTLKDLSNQCSGEDVPD